MKKAQYQCLKCFKPTFFQVRETGNIPTTIGCMTKGCDGKSEWKPNIFNPSGKIHGIFFKPKTKEEWKAVQTQLEFEIRQKYPTAGDKEVVALRKVVMVEFRSFVETGGLLFLPKAYFLKKTPMKKVD